MVDVSFTMVMQWVNFGVLLFLLHTFLFKPLMGFLDKRSKDIADAIKDAEDNRKKSEESLASYEKKLSNVKNESDALIEAAKLKADDEKQRILLQTQQEARSLIDDAKQEIANETERAKQELTKNMAAMIVSCAAKVLEREVNEADHHQLIESFIANNGQ